MKANSVRAIARTDELREVAEECALHRLSLRGIARHREPPGRPEARSLGIPQLRQKFLNRVGLISV